MIERLRRKFIIISMCSVFAVLGVIISISNISNYMQISRDSDAMLEFISFNGGHFPKKGNYMKEHSNMSPEAPFSTRFFTVNLDLNGTVQTIDTGKIAAVTTKEAKEYAAKVYEKGKPSGLIGGYKYKSTATVNGTMVVFLDCTREFKTFQDFLEISLFVSFLGLAAVFILVVIFSKRAIKPVAESYEKQKRFITDAGHEIKTPLTIIDANTEVLELDYGESEWTKSIRNQIKRLSQLTTDLVYLSKMDEEQGKLQMVEFSLSDAVLDSGEPFIALSKAHGKKLRFSVEENLTYTGNEQAIRQLVSILLDNGVKYAVLGTEIEVTLKRQGKYKCLCVSNQAQNISQGNLDILFERFYRMDQSRNSETGGHGIGLSIAKAIVLSHKGKIKAESPDGKSLKITAFL